MTLAGKFFFPHASLAPNSLGSFRLYDYFFGSTLPRDLTKTRPQIPRQNLAKVRFATSVVSSNRSSVATINDGNVDY